MLDLRYVYSGEGRLTDDGSTGSWFDKLTMIVVRQRCTRALAMWFDRLTMIILSAMYSSQSKDGVVRQAHGSTGSP